MPTSLNEIVDKQLRELERQANTGDPDARERLCAYKNRLAGLVGYPNKELEEFTKEEIKNTACFAILHKHAKDMLNLKARILAITTGFGHLPYIDPTLISLCKEVLSSCAGGWRAGAASFEKHKQGISKALDKELVDKTVKVYETTLEL